MGDAANEPGAKDPFVLDEDQSTPEEEQVLKDTESTEPVVKEADEEEEYREISEDGWEDILGSGRLRKRVIQEGIKGHESGQGRPNRGDVVICNVKGFFQDELFEETKGLEFMLSEAEVLQALDLVVALMNAGEVCEIIADPEFAYGDVGFQGDLVSVPPKAAVRFEVELVSHNPSLPFGEITDVQEKLRIGRRKKDRGTYWFQRQNHTFAVQCYRKAGDYFDDEKLELEVPVDRYQLSEELQTLLEERLKAFNNLAMAQMKLEAWDSAMASLRQVLKIEPNNEKALYRKSKVLTEKGLVDEAIGTLRRATRLYPNNQSAKTDLSKLIAKQKKSRLNEQNMSRRMLGLDKPSKPDETFGQRAWSFLSQNKVMVTSMAVGITSLAAAAAAAASGGYFSDLPATRA